uniref:Transcription factor E2F7 n=1 Tax=Gadus morhua TaxID=8049 RepID=A0A8C5FL50_GADMO
MLYYIDLIVDVILGVILYRCYIILDVMHYVILYRFNTRSSPQENICTGRPAPTRTPAELQSPADMRTPVKHAGDSPQPEPWTPTANLKMLISAASPDIRRSYAMETLFTPPCDAVEEEEEEGEDGEAKPSRKQRSLGLLCQRFLALYPDHPQDNVTISLDEVASSLGVERRRIYDIINVLESLSMVDRVAKNCYTWWGRRRLGARLGELQRHAHQRCPGGSHPVDWSRLPVLLTANRKDKSLRIMSQRFVSLFLVSESQCVTLETAAQLLIDHNATSHSKYKTKVRRLYDIANVLTSLALIKKLHVRGDRGRKPAFQWLGPICFSTPPGEALGPRPSPVEFTCLCSAVLPVLICVNKVITPPRVSDHTPSSLTPPPSSGLNSINFLLSASQSAAGLSLPTLALPYVLLPSYPVAPGDAHPSPLGFLSQANFLMGAAGPYGHPGAELGVTLAPPPQKTTPTPSGGTFFQTPGTLGSVVPAIGRRKRGSAQRRLDVGHTPQAS